MDMFYRVLVVRDGLRRAADFSPSQLPIVVREAEQAGFRVTYTLMPADAERLPGVLEEPTDMVMN